MEWNYEAKTSKTLKTHHSIIRCSFGKTSSEAVNLGRIVLVRPHQPPPDLGINFHRSFSVDNVSHSTGSSQLVVTRYPVVPSPLDVPCNQVSRSSVCVGVFKKRVPYCVADEEVKFWCSLVGQTNLNNDVDDDGDVDDDDHCVLPLVAKNK